ncbi:MAG TPA: amino acid permease [Methylibium sp.]|uniref:APC family permease n=1 Tax=Methylibium sp. TaxID=2067992 RepID=UPI002DBFAFC3|nr:amino acid permease [Methylibium sp.]HEU4458591.1 amino acid permease [Methylibium sp.]
MDAATSSRLPRRPALGASSERSNVQQAPRAVLGVGAAVAIIVGIVVGAGIFKAPSMVAGLSGGAGWMFAAWAVGGLVSLVGALCYAELASAYPDTGGDYHFLRLAYGRHVAFLFAWARFAVITTGSIALLGFVFGDYMQQLLPLGAHGEALYAVAAIVALAAVNLRGLRSGAATQGGLTLLEVAGLLLIVAAGLWLLLGGTAAPPAPAAPAEPAGWGSLGMAMVFVLLTYGGWNEAAYLSAEIKEDPLRRGRRLRLALLLSIGAITALYLLVNWAYWQGLGLAGMARSEAIAADLLRSAFGEAGAVLVAAVVALAALTSINATLIVGARTTCALGRDWRALRRLGDWDAERGTPRVALLAQTLAALALVALGAAAQDGFRAMVEFTAPVFWLFFLLAGVSLFVLRRKDPRTERPCPVPLYPWLPALFVAVCAGMLASSLSYVGSQTLGGFNAAWIGVAVLATGALLMALLPRSTPPARRTR